MLRVTCFVKLFSQFLASRLIRGQKAGIKNAQYPEKIPIASRIAKKQRTLDIIDAICNVLVSLSSRSCQSELNLSSLTGL